MKRLNRHSNDYDIKRKNLSQTDSECQYFVPLNQQEAVLLLAKYGEKIKVLAGGTDLLVQYFDRLYEVEKWLDLRKLDELIKIKKNNKYVYIGAMTTHAQINKSKIIRRYFPVLSRAADDIGSPQIKNRGTIGGNVVNASPAGDLLPSLIAYKAQFHLLSDKEETIIPANKFFIGPKKTVLMSDQLLIKIALPLPPKNTYGCWIKIGKRKALIISTITLALVVNMDSNNKLIQNASVCLGSVAPTPIEIKLIKDELVGKRFNQLNFSQLGQIVEDKISPIDDIRGTKEYRKDVAREIMINALEEVNSAIKGGLR